MDDPISLLQWPAMAVTLIAAWLRNDIPFDQWRLYKMGKSEKAALQRLKLRKDYDEARRRVAAVRHRSSPARHRSN